MRKILNQEDHDGIVDIGRDIEGVEISIFLRETEKNTFKLSLRSNNDVNVSTHMPNVWWWRTHESCWWNNYRCSFRKGKRKNYNRM